MLCAGTGIPTTPLQHPLYHETPTSPSKPTLGVSLVPSSLSPHHIPWTQPIGYSSLSPLCVQGEPAPGGFTPLLPLQAVFLPLSSFHQAANMLSEQ